MAEEKVLGIKPEVKNEEKITTEIYRDIFVLVTRNDKTQIAIQNSIIWREEFESIQDAKDFIDEKPWGLIVNTVLFIQQQTKDLK